MGYNEKTLNERGKNTLEIGKRIRKARLEAGLSQSQLCGDQITRNMLSQIENGSANPSLSTLSYVSQVLRKPVGYFFGEDAPSGRAQVDAAWRAYRDGKIQEAARILDARKDPDGFEDVKLLRCLVLLSLAEQAIREKRAPYAREMLNWVQKETPDFPEIQRRMLLLRGKLEGEAEEVCRQLPSLDEELLLRAEASFASGDCERTEKLLEAAEDQENPRWAMLRGRVYFRQNRFQHAARCFHRAEEAFPRETAPCLEQCYREL